jgi:molybdopterin converting factor small subunit
LKVQVELHAVLKDLIPGGKGELDAPEGAKVSELLDQLGVDPELRELVTLNGEQTEDLEAAELKDGDTVAVFPAVSGGARTPYLDEGIKLFNEGDYFMSHETLEEHWVEAEESERDFFQGLIHLAVGFHHYERGNHGGAKSQFAKGLRRLSGYPDQHEGVDVGAIRSFLEEAPGRIDRGEPLTPPPLT